MNAWIYIGLFVAILFAAMLFVGRLPRRTWEITAAALILGLTGYALQGRSALPGAPAKAAPAKKAAGEALIEMRADMAPNYDVSRQWTITADSLARSGKYPYAMAFVQSGLKRHPKNAHLWSALGLYSMLASDGQLSEPAKFAFLRARKFRKNHPAPDYFEGLAALFEGKPAETLEKWGRAVDNAPKDAKWVPKLQGQLNALISAANRSMQESTLQGRDTDNEGN